MGYDVLSPGHDAAPLLGVSSSVNILRFSESICRHDTLESAAYYSLDVHDRHPLIRKGFYPLVGELLQAL